MAVRSLLLALTTALLALSVAAPAQAAITWGLGDNDPRFFSDARWQSLPLKQVRRTVDWDTPSDPVKASELDTWMAAARSAGATPLLAIDRSWTVGRENAKPSVATYRSLITWLRSRYPWWNRLTPWNEANGRRQPTYKNPKLAWQYYSAAKKACKSCTVTSPVILFGKGVSEKWLKPFLKAGGNKIRLWAFHNYGDLNRKTNTSLKRFEKQTKGTIWVTEAAGWVKFLNTGEWPYNEARAASVIDYTFKALKGHPRIKAVYWWQWYGTSGANIDWDTGFLNPDGSERPGYQALLRGLGR